MARRRLRDRRPCVTRRIAVALDGGHPRPILITVGYDEHTRLPREVFCADFKAGSAIQAMVMDACVLLSRLMQHGDSPEELSASLCSPPSLVGAIMQAVVEEHRVAQEPRS